MRLWELMRLALGGIRRTPLRMALTVLGVAIATGLWVSLVGFCLGVQKRIEEPFQKLELFNRLNVTPRSPPTDSVSHNGKAGPTTPAPILDDAAIARILRLSGVAVAYPDLHVSGRDAELSAGLLDKEGKPLKEKPWVQGLPRESGRLRYVHESMVQGRFFSPNKGTYEAVVGRQLAKKLGFEPATEAVGKTLTLKVNGYTLLADRTQKPEKREVELTIVGLWDPASGTPLFSTDLLLLPVDVVRELPGALSKDTLDIRDDIPLDQPLGYRRVVVRVERPADLFEVEEKIKAMGYQTENRLGEIKEMREFFILMDLVWGSVGAVALTIAGLGIINTMLMAVLERTREIGAFKALGASNGDIRLMFLFEAGLVGVLGGLFGLVLGRVVSWLCEIGFNAFARSKGIVDPMASHFPLSLLLSAMGFALLVSLISGVYPASRAANVDPIKALRSE